MKKILSPYTIASNCTDLTDVADGLQELNEAITELQNSGEKVPQKYYNRLCKLKAKQLKLEKHIYLVSVGLYNSPNTAQYAETKYDAIQLAISLVNIDTGGHGLIITQEPKVTATYPRSQYYQFSASIKGKEESEQQFDFCILTAKVFKANHNQAN